MKKYEYRNYRRVEKADGSVTYFIVVEGKFVEVDKAIYMAYRKGCRKIEYMERDLKRDRVLRDEKGKAILDENGQLIILPEREESLEKLIDEDLEFPSSEPLPEEAAMKQSEIEGLYYGLTLLDADERKLINALFFDGFSERGYSSKTGIPQKTINDRKCKILNKLKNILQKL